MIDDSFLQRLPNPQVFTGREINVVCKPARPGDLRVCLVFPDVYEIGMSHGGLKLLYHFLNDRDGVVAERAFLPEAKGVEVFRSSQVPLFSLEGRRPLGAFDVIGISLMSELNFTNVPLLLELAQIPLKAADRGAEHPLIVAGGIAAVNPEPLRQFVDLFAIGDGEALFPPLLEAVRRWKESNRDRASLLQELDRQEGMYAPSLHPLQMEGLFLLPRMEGRRVRKSVMEDFGRFRYQEKEIVPIGNAVFSRQNVEIARGCPQRCRFCQARVYYAPYRVRDRGLVLKFIGGALAQTGYESFSLCSLSAGDYPHLEDLLTAIPGLLGPGISFSVPSLRPAVLSGRLLETIGLFRRTGITIVPEAGSPRLRRVIGKNVTDAEVHQAVELAMAHGWQRIKLYFMIGLPGEKEADVDQTVGLIGRIAQHCRDRKRWLQIHASFSPFVPKPHTPFQWMPTEAIEVLEEKIRRIRSGLRSWRNVQLDFHSPEKAYVETALARGDARMGDVILAAYQRGEVFTAWEDHFHFPVWREEIQAAGLEFMVGGFSEDTVFPWSYLDLFGRSSWLREEYRSAVAEMEAPSPPATERDAPSPSPVASPSSPPSVPVKCPDSTPYHKIRLVFEKNGDFRFFSQLSLAQYLERVLRLCGLRFKCTEGFHPRIRMSFLSPLPVGAAGENEVVEVSVAAGVEPQKVLDAVSAHSPFLRFKGAHLSAGRPSLAKDIRSVHYRFLLAGEPWPVEPVRALVGTADRLDIAREQLDFFMDGASGGLERFFKVYKVLDPDRSRTSRLVRLGVEFNT